MGEQEEEVGAGEEEETTLIHQLQGPLDQSHLEPQVQIPDLPFLLSPPGSSSHNLHMVASAWTPTVMPLCVTVVRTRSS